MFSLLAVLLAQTQAFAAPAPLFCEYQLMNIPFSQVRVVFNEDGSYPDGVEIIMQGRKHLESFTVEEKTDGEHLHAWISKEVAENAIEMIVQEKEGLPSVLINHKMPMGKEVWGKCKYE